MYSWVTKLTNKFSFFKKPLSLTIESEPYAVPTLRQMMLQDDPTTQTVKHWLYGTCIEGDLYSILADVLAMDNSTVGAATRLFCGFFLK
jgi:hypothetical protein